MPIRLQIVVSVQGGLRSGCWLKMRPVGRVMTEAATREVERDMAKPCTSNKGGASKSRSTRPLESGGSLRMPLSLRRSQRGMDGQKESSRALSRSGFWGLGLRVTQRAPTITSTRVALSRIASHIDRHRHRGRGLPSLLKPRSHLRGSTPRMMLVEPSWD